MFYVKKQEYTTKTFRLTVSLVERLETLAQNKNVSLNQLISQCCEYALENLGDEPAKEAADIAGEQKTKKEDG